MRIRSAQCFLKGAEAEGSEGYIMIIKLHVIYNGSHASREKKLFILLDSYLFDSHFGDLRRFLRDTAHHSSAMIGFSITFAYFFLSIYLVVDVMPVSINSFLYEF